jgi:hypothetical protein
MTGAEVLKKAIEKAKENGFEMDKHKHFCEIGRDNFTGEIVSLGAYQSILFDHSFAKALWGEEKIIERETCFNCSQPAEHRVWYGRGRETGDALGDMYYPIGSECVCGECFKEFHLGQELNGQKIWKQTSSLPEHEELRIRQVSKIVSNCAFKYHLQQMVLFENPIDYLRKFIKEEVK